MGGPGSELNEQIITTYDPAGQVVGYSLQGGLVEHTFAYDTLAQLRHGYDRDVGHRSWSWDDHGRLTQVLNGTGNTISYEYDAAGRLAERRLLSGPGGSIDETATFTYDLPGSLGVEVRQRRPSRAPAPPRRRERTSNRPGVNELVDLLVEVGPQGGFWQVAFRSIGAYLAGVERRGQAREVQPCPAQQQPHSKSRFAG